MAPNNLDFFLTVLIIVMKFAVHNAIGGFEIFGSEIVWVKKTVKWVVLPSKSSLATIKQVSKSFTKNLKIDRKFP